MKNETIISIIIGALVLLAAVFIAGYLCGKARDNQRVADYQSTIESVTEVLERHGITVGGIGKSFIESDRLIESIEKGLSELDRRNSEAEDRAENAIDALRKAGVGMESAYGLAGKIGTGIDSVIEKVKRLGDS